MSRAVVLTGAAGGMGLAIAETLAADGWQVLGFDLRFPGDQAHLAKAVEQDITDSAGFRAALTEVVAHYKVTALVNCAGVSRVGRFLDMAEADWKLLLDINFTAPLIACQALAPVIAANGGGSIVNITSDSARVGAAGEAVYSGAKGGIATFSKSLAQEVGRLGITVNCVSPGIIATPMSAPNQDLIAKLVKKVPMGRVGEPQDVAGAVAYLLGPGARYVTGQTLSVGGGLTMAG
jgi:2-hydroxycyclohexanecarboxyl-CoA dehydrogenase